MIGFGLGEVFGCFFIGFIVDKFGSRKAALFNSGICIIMTTLTMIYVTIYDFNALAYAMTFFWGFQDSAVNTHC